MSDTKATSEASHEARKRGFVWVWSTRHHRSYLDHYPVTDKSGSSKLRYFRLIDNLYSYSSKATLLMRVFLMSFAYEHMIVGRWRNRYRLAPLVKNSLLSIRFTNR